MVLKLETTELSDGVHDESGWKSSRDLTYEVYQAGHSTFVLRLLCRMHRYIVYLALLPLRGWQAIGLEHC